MKYVYIGLFIVVTIIIGMSILGWKLSSIIKDRMESDMVTGYQHVYRGQTLIPDKELSLIVLSKRASYLNSRIKLDIRVRNQLEQMIVDAEQEGMCLVVTDGYRTYEKQLQLYELITDKSKVAIPGQSEHQTGLAIDITACPMKNGIRNDSVKRPELELDFDRLPEYKWLQNNAAKYGFEQSYTKSNKSITGYPAEAWHWKFIIKE